MSIVVTTPTGNIGAPLALRLLNAGEKVTVIARDASKVKNLADLGATVVEGDQSKADVLEKAFKGAKSVFWLIPPINGPTYTQWAIDSTKLAAEKGKEHGVTHFVYLSAIGAQYGRGSGVIEFHAENERALERLIPNVVSLRAAFFYENFLRDLGSIGGQGAVYVPYQLDKQYPFVAVSDIADAAFRYLVTGWSGQSVVGVHGSKHYSYAQAWAIISKAIGKDIKVIQANPEAALAGMKQYGLPDFISQAFYEFIDAWVKGKSFVAEVRTPETTTPTTLHEWAVRVFKPAATQQK